MAYIFSEHFLTCFPESDHYRGQQQTGLRVHLNNSVCKVVICQDGMDIFYYLYWDECITEPQLQGSPMAGLVTGQIGQVLEAPDP